MTIRQAFMQYRTKLRPREGLQYRKNETSSRGFAMFSE